MIGAKGTTVSFSAQDRRGFPQNGAVVRVIENNKHGPVVFAGVLKTASRVLLPCGISLS